MTASNVTATDSSATESFCPTSPDVWHKSAPSKVRKAHKMGDFEDAWSAWCAYLAKRKQPAPLDRLFSAKQPSLLWALSDSVVSDQTTQLVARLSRLAVKGGGSSNGWEDETSRWLSETTAAGNRVDFAVEAIAWAGALPSLAGAVSSDAWWAVLNRLADISVDAAKTSADQSPLVGQLLAGELPLAVAYALPELAKPRKWPREARRVLEGGIDELLDGEGLPRAENMPLLRPFLACWTRCQMLARHCKKAALGEAAAGQFEWAVRQALRWTRADGTQVLGDDAACAELFAAALALDDDEDDADIATLVLPGSKKAERDRVSRYAQPEAASHSEWSAAAVLRPDWPHSGAQLSILYPDRQVRAELSARGEVLLSGAWDFEVRLDGKLLTPVGDWQESCWVSDDEVDFLELEIELAEGVHVERQMVMSRDDNFLLLADVVLGERAGRLEYRGRLPLSADVELDQAAETREAVFVGRRRLAMLMPIALPEWRSDARVGTLDASGNHLELCMKAEGNSIYCPMWFDFDARRADRQRTWRQLTVAESLEVQPADVAVGYRVHSGGDQWLIYRSLAERANRTLLGHNLSSEMLVARFDETGEVESLVEVE